MFYRSTIFHDDQDQIKIKKKYFFEIKIKIKINDMTNIEIKSNQQKYVDRSKINIDRSRSKI